MKPTMARNRIKKLDRRIRLLKNRENRLIRTIVRLEGQKENLSERLKGGKKDPDLAAERVGATTTGGVPPALLPQPGALQKLEKTKETDASVSPGGTLISSVQSLLPKGLELEKVETEIQRLKTNSERVERLLREADESMDSLVRSMGFIGVKPKRGSWAYRRWRRQQKQPDRNQGGFNIGGLDMDTLLGLASLVTGREENTGNPTMQRMNMFGELIKTPAVQNLVLKAVAGLRSRS
ncbi:MAG: hypothetical protein PHC60_03485 [Heliobacteriaceae bacterium]|nr:hypothetical protein [Heliobacteriaceae bacterium]MDD4587443.1 hypothetical protein [Heliobacteriaceae bacterium]